MAIKKSELYSSLWASCDELRGGMDASQYKDYVLVLLFVKYVSDKYAGQKDALIDVPKSGSFSDMVALKGDKEIGDKMNKIISKLAKANDLSGVIDVADFNDADKLGKGKDMVDRLSNLVSIFNGPNLDFRSNRAEGDDLLGDAYEYLMRHFATESGKSKGQFYTPAEVSRIIAKVIGLGSARSASQTIYDPTCGSGSLLIKAHDEAKSQTGHDLAIYGQEMDNATYALANMNAILHDCPTREIWKDNTLSTPHFKDDKGRLKTFDFAVANPPFSFKAWSNGFDPEHDLYGRFELGIPPEKNGDFAFLLHVIASLKSNGKGAIIMPHGVLFRGGAEGNIRKNIIQRGYIKGIIGLPANLFYGTGIPACIIILDKENAAARKGIFMIDASQAFIKDGPKNRLRAQDIHKIVDTFTKQLEVPKYSRMVPVVEIEKNEFNLNLPRYIDSQTPEDMQDIAGHLNGGMPVADVNALEQYWAVCPKLKKTLFKPNRSGYVDLAVAKGEIKKTIYDHPEFTTYISEMNAHFIKWRSSAEKTLKKLKTGIHPKEVIENLSEELLEHYTGKALIDNYAVYQHLMDYWAETMQDDCYQLAVDGWKAETYRVIEIKKAKDGKTSKQVDKGWACDLIPKQLIVSRYFTKEQETVDKLTSDLEAVTARIAELEEEHGGEEGAFSDLDKINKANVAAQLKKIKADKDAKEETAVLNEWMKLNDEESQLKKKLKDAEADLDAKAYGKYPKLSESEIKSLVVDDKWLGALDAAIHGEMDRISQSLTQRVKELAERYETPMPKLEGKTSTFSAKVWVHLKRMGLHQL